MPLVAGGADRVESQRRSPRAGFGMPRRSHGRSSRAGRGPVLGGLRRGRGMPMLGLREVTIVATVVLVLYGRSGVLRSRRFQSIWPWIAPVRRKPAQPGAARRDTGPRPPRGRRRHRHDRPYPQAPPVPARGEPPVLVLDDPGRDGRGQRDRHPAADPARRRSLTDSLTTPAASSGSHVRPGVVHRLPRSRESLLMQGTRS